MFTPDKSTACNEMQIENDLKKPSYKAWYLKDSIANTSTLPELLWTGRKPANHLFFYDNNSDTSSVNMLITQPCLKKSDIIKEK